MSSKINNVGTDAITTLVTLTKTSLNDKVDKVDGKGLSTNDFTTDEKTKLAGLANTTVVDNLTSTDAASALSANQGKALDEKITALNNSVPKKVSDLTNDSGFQTANEVMATVNAKVASTYKAAGSVAFADLPAADKAHLGMVYNVTDAFTTTDTFSDGTGKSYPAGSNVVIVATGEGDPYPHVNSNDIMVTREGYRVTDAYGINGEGYVLIKPEPDSDGGRPYRVCDTFMVDAAIASNPDFNYNSIPIEWNTIDGYVNENGTLRNLCYGDPVYGYDVLSGFVDLSGYVATGDITEMTADDITALWNSVTV